RAALPDGTDPAQILQTHGPAKLFQVLHESLPQADHMVRERRSSLARHEGMIQQVEILAARPGHRWAELDKMHARNNEEADSFKQQLLDSATEWTATPAAARDRTREQTQQLRQRLQQPARQPKSSGVPAREQHATRMRATRSNRGQTPIR